MSIYFIRMSLPNISNVLYLAFRLGPFIMVCCFLLQSILFWDMKGIVYLAGLLMACLANVIVNNVIKGEPAQVDPNPTCGLISIGEGNAFYSKLPISMTVYSYTFWFLFMFVVNIARSTNDNNLGNIHGSNLASAFQQNVPILVFFPLLMLMETAWISANQCVPSWLYTFASFAVGGFVGFLWGLAMIMTNSPMLQYITKPGVSVCTMASKKVFQCKLNT